MNKIRVLANIVIVCIILSIAIYFPNIVSSYLQKSLEGKLNFVDVGVKTYEVEYNNIREKIFSINEYNQEYDGEIKTVPIVTEITEELKENLTKQVLLQLKKFQKGISYQFFDLDKENLIYCEKYAIYSSKETSGISFWKLKYQKKEENIKIIMDTEFNYIYVFQLESRLKRIEKIFKQCIKKMKELSDVWVANICEYFEFESELEKGNISIISLNSEPYYIDDKNDIHYINYYYLIRDELNYWSLIDKYDKDDTNMSGSYDCFDIPIKMRYEYQKKEKKLIIDWGLGFFDSMIQF